MQNLFLSVSGPRHDPERRFLPTVTRLSLLEKPRQRGRFLRCHGAPLKGILAPAQSDRRVCTPMKWNHQPVFLAERKKTNMSVTISVWLVVPLSTPGKGPYPLVSVEPRIIR
jgi:hypothetical protein